MIDKKILRDDTLFNRYADDLRRRGEDEQVLFTLREDEKSLRDEMNRVQGLKTNLNDLSRRIGIVMLDGNKEAADEIKKQCAGLKEEIVAGDVGLKKLRLKIEYSLLRMPNWLDESVPDGSDEAANVVVKDAEGELPTGTPHWELDGFGIDPAAGAKLSGSRFTVLRGQAALLNRALGEYLLRNAAAYFYEQVSTPVLVNPEIMQGTGQLPKFEDDAYTVFDKVRDLGTEDERSLFKFLIPTAEVSLTNLYRDEITDIYEDGKPIRMCALTPCFRREAGSAGRDTRGLLRQHQFEKVELVSICQAENVEFEHDMMLQTAETALEELGLKYRRVLLCAGDTGFSARKTYDLEVWMAGTQEFREIASISQCGDFQSRRMNARIRVEGEKPEFPHTLNGSALAVGRLLAAFVETHGTDLRNAPEPLQRFLFL